MKPLTDSSFIEALETLAAHFQWQSCCLQADRQPNGQCRFWAYVNSDTNKGLESFSAFGDTPMQAVQSVIAYCPLPLPEVIKEKAIRKLEEQLAKLRDVVFPPPPYRPGTYLPEHASDSVDV